MDEILKFLIGTTAVSTLLIFLGKYILYIIKDLSLQKYKSELTKETIKFQRELDRKIEKFKISYSHLFVEQVVIIKETYKKLIRAEKPLEYLMRPVKFNRVKSDEEIANEVVERANELFDYFDENQIMFSEKTSETFDQIRGKYVEVWNTFSIKQMLGDKIHSESLVKMIDEMHKAYDVTLKGEMQKLKRQLRTEFQEQLGILEGEISHNSSKKE